jgi:hypothetical protein
MCRELLTLQNIYCKWPYGNSKNVGVGFLSLCSDNIVMSLYNEV